MRRTLQGYNALEVFFAVLAILLAISIPATLIMIPCAVLAAVIAIALNAAKRRFVARYAAALATSLKCAASTPT